MENNINITEYAREFAKAERELKIEYWVYVTIEVRHPDGTREVLHKYDIPRNMLDRWQWVIKWRKSKLVCENPRKNIEVYHCFYDKRTGLQTGFDTLLGRVSAAKAQITKVQNAIAKYIEYKSHNDLFFCADTDEQLIKAYEKLEQKKKNYANIYAVLQEEVIKHQQNKNKYKLFIGFKKLGEFDSIKEAKQFADATKLTGAFNLLGDKYRDSWYVAS